MTACTSRSLATARKRSSFAAMRSFEEDTLLLSTHLQAKVPHVALAKFMQSTPSSRCSCSHARCKHVHMPSSQSGSPGITSPSAFITPAVHCIQPATHAVRRVHSNEPSQAHALELFRQVESSKVAEHGRWELLLTQPLGLHAELRSWISHASKVQARADRDADALSVCFRQHCRRFPREPQQLVPCHVLHRSSTCSRDVSVGTYRPNLEHRQVQVLVQQRLQCEHCPTAKWKLARESSARNMLYSLSTTVYNLAVIFADVMRFAARESSPLAISESTVCARRLAAASAVLKRRRGLCRAIDRRCAVKRLPDMTSLAHSSASTRDWVSRHRAPDTFSDFRSWATRLQCTWVPACLGWRRGLALQPRRHAPSCGQEAMRCLTKSFRTSFGHSNVSCEMRPSCGSSWSRTSRTSCCGSQRLISTGAWSPPLVPGSCTVGLRRGN